MPHCGRPPRWHRQRIGSRSWRRRWRSSNRPALLWNSRTLLVELGAFLVARGDDKDAAREVLRRGADAAFRCSATPLVNRAVQLLRSTGARPRRVALTGTGALTPMERRAAELALAGHANAEIAEMLFVNNKTVEAHLSRVYRKLRIRSRRQLPNSLARAREEENELELTGSDGTALETTRKAGPPRRSS